MRILNMYQNIAEMVLLLTKLTEKDHNLLVHLHGSHGSPGKGAHTDLATTLMVASCRYFGPHRKVREISNNGIGEDDC